jgi:hypothetical protein
MPNTRRFCRRKLLQIHRRIHRLYSNADYCLIWQKLANLEFGEMGNYFGEMGIPR